MEHGEPIMMENFVTDIIVVVVIIILITIVIIIIIIIINYCYYYYLFIFWKNLEITLSFALSSHT